MAFVLDCSATMCCCFQEEAPSYASKVLALLDSDDAWVPSIWPLEVSNSLVVAERRERIEPADVSTFIAVLDACPIRIDSETSDRALNQILSLARETGLSSYDAAYLELAMREGLPLATLDAPLRQTAADLGVTIIQP